MTDADTIHGVDVDTVLSAYVACALWSSSVEEDGLETLRRTRPDDVPSSAAPDYGLDRFGLTMDDIAAESLASMRDDVCSFLSGPDYEGSEASDDDVVAHARALEFWTEHHGAEHIGHDFWLTRNGHGAGFWDRWSGGTAGYAFGKYLTDQSKPYGESELYIGDDGEVHVS